MNTTVFADTIDGVREYLNTIPRETDKLRVILGLVKAEHAPKLVGSIIVNSIDTEHYERNQSILMEIGINAFDAKSLRQHANSPGANGENLLKEIYYYHFRIKQHAQYINKKFCPGDPDSNRFGNTRFTTLEEAKDMLTSSFVWDVDTKDPQGDKCPVILLGHDIRMDTNFLANSTGFDLFSTGTVVATIDTQQMAREMGISNPSGNPKDKIALRDLVKQFDIPYRNPHTAGNDAAYTTISAIYMALYGRTLPASTKSVLESINEVESASRKEVASIGVAKYCARCHRTSHFRSQCTVHIPPCSKCQARREPGPNGKLPNVHFFTRGNKSHYPEDCTWAT